MIFLYVSLSALFYCTYGSSTKNASVTYDIQSGKFNIHDFIADGAIAYGNFKDEIFQNGWSFLEVYTQESFPDPSQAYAAGLIEGYLTRDLLRKHWNNMVADYCANEKLFCKRLSDFIQNNLDFIKQNVQAKRFYDVYWHQTALTLEQLHGLEDGYKNITSKPSIKVDVFGMLLLNLMGDLGDLEEVLNKKSKVFSGEHCSALIKVLPNNRDIYFSHNTWTSFNSMLRILKKYSLKFHTSMSSGSPVVPGHTYTFSSQPGLLFSLDDFYLVSSGLAVMETTIQNFNDSLWQYVKPSEVILEWQRTITANRLAKNGMQWVTLFGIMNSGTYNNQWMVLDYNRFKPNKPLQDGLLFVLEQLPGFLHTKDVTDVLRSSTFWPSYNRAYFPDIFNMSDAQKMVDKFGDWFTFDKCPRALIFQRDQGMINDVSSMMKMMRYNDYANDPLSRCNCTPPRNAYNAISARSDLNPPDGTYPIEDLGHKPFGAIDVKLTTSELFKSLQFVAVAGPTYDSLPPFQWSKSDFDKKVKHEGHPDLFNFKPITHKWKEDLLG